ncbi:MAG TPA: hypothetical protein VGJ92_09200 [Methanocella sp.]
MESPLSFSTPRFFLRTGGHFIRQWKEAELIIPGYTKEEYDKGNVPDTTIHINGSRSKNPFQAKKIRIDPHDFISSFIEFNIYNPPKIFKRWFGLIGKRWVEGKIIVMAAGCRSISKIVRFDEIIIEDMSYAKVIDQGDGRVAVYGPAITQKKIK